MDEHRQDEIRCQRSPENKQCVIDIRNFNITSRKKCLIAMDSYISPLCICVCFQNKDNKGQL